MIKVQNYDLYRRDIRELVESKPREVSEAICAEEPAEMIQALCKIIRYRAGDVTVGTWDDVRQSLIEEMADTLISIDILKILYDISDAAVDEMLVSKNTRNMQRLRDANAGRMPEDVKRAMAAAHECCGRCVD